jgi:tetratricopeptide (TPR) repeat protein
LSPALIDEERPMTEWHPEREALERFLDDELTDEESRTLQRHLLTCSLCEERLIALLPHPGEAVAADGSAAHGAALFPEGSEYRGLVRRILRESRQEIERRKSQLVSQRREARGTWRELRRLSVAARREAVESDPRYWQWELFELLLEGAREEVLKEPQRAEEMLQLALAISARLDAASNGPGAVEAAKGRVWACLGNALRVRSDFPGSERAFATAEAHLAASWLDPLDEALVLEYKASLRRSQSRFAEALAMLDAAIAIYREVNEPHLQGRALMAKGLVHQYERDFATATTCFRNSLFLLDGAREPRLMVLCQASLVYCLHDSGNTAEAAALLPEARQLMLQCGRRRDLLRLRWLEGQIAAALGQTLAAEQAFLEASDGFTVDRDAFDAALVSLDLTALYARQGRTAEIRRLTEEMLPVFQACDLHHEAIAALIVLQKAAELEQMTAGLVEEVASFVKRVRANPELRFRNEV